MTTTFSSWFDDAPRAAWAAGDQIQETVVDVSTAGGEGFTQMPDVYIKSETGWKMYQLFIFSIQIHNFNSY